MITFWKAQKKIEELDGSQYVFQGSNIPLVLRYYFFK